MNKKTKALSALIILLLATPLWSAPRLNFRKKPISYSSTEANNDISNLQKKLKTSNDFMTNEKQFGYLLPLLKELDISVYSQMLIFSKTSQQKLLISPEIPRALYFNDDIYIGYVREGFIEIMVTDPKLGIAFYTLEDIENKPFVEQQSGRCLTCHSTNHTKNVPGLQVRSHLVDPEGHPVFSAGHPRTDHGTPLSERWGGWYVTGTHGNTTHLGNYQLPTSKRPDSFKAQLDRSNITDLSWFIDVEQYPTPDSDIVALMVFEHQVDAHNYMTRTNYAWHIDVHNKNVEKLDANWKQEAKQLIEHLFFVGEAKLKYPIKGTSLFSKEFATRGPFDKNRNSLRRFDLKERLFHFPCSYTVHSKRFQSLPKPVLDHIYSRMEEILSEDNKDQKYKHLIKTDRANLRELLPELLPNLKKIWN